MPDISNPIAGLYPQPPTAPTNALMGNPLELLGAVSQARALASKQAVGSAFQNALNPDGSIDQGRLASGLQDPAAAYAAPEAIGDMITQRGNMIANDTASLKLAASQNGVLQDSIGAMANDPTLTPTKVYSTITGIAGRLNLPSSMLMSVLQTMPQSGNPVDLQKWAAGLGNIAMGTTGASDRVAGPPSATGAPTTISKGQANILGVGGGTGRGAQPSSGPGIATDLPPGQRDVLAGNEKSYFNDQQNSAATLANVRNLTTAIPLLGVLGPGGAGPTSPEWAQARSFLQTNGIISQNDTDPNVIRDKAQKYLEKYVSNSPIAGRSDMATQVAAMSSPNLDTSLAATLDLAKAAVGFDRMDAALPKAFDIENPGRPNNAGYSQYKSNYYAKVDPRAFNFDQMTPQDRADLQKSLGPKTSAAYKKFVYSYNLAKQTGMLPAPQPTQGAQ